MGQIGCPETSVTNYKSRLRKIPTKRRSSIKIEQLRTEIKKKIQHFAAE